MNKLNYAMHSMWKNKIGLLLASVSTVLMVNTYFAAGALAICVAGLTLARDWGRDQSISVSLGKGTQLSSKQLSASKYTLKDVDRKFRELDHLTYSNLREIDELYQAYTPLLIENIELSRAAQIRMTKAFNPGRRAKPMGPGGSKGKFMKDNRERIPAQLLVERLQAQFRSCKLSYRAVIKKFISSQAEFDQLNFEQQILSLDKQINRVGRAHRMRMEVGEALLEVLNESRREIGSFVEELDNHLKIICS